jgi:AraC family ethanolamine operon transcriptional activator
MAATVSLRETGVGAVSRPYSHIATRDVDHHGRAAMGFQHVYEQVERGPFSGCVTDLALGPVRLLRDQVDNPIAYRGVVRQGPLVFFSFLPSRGGSYCNGRPIDSNVVIKLPRDFTLHAFCDGPTDSIAVSIDPDFLAARTNALVDAALTAADLQQTFHVAEAETVARFQSCALDLLRTVAIEPALAEDPAWRAAATNRVLEVLLEVIRIGMSAPNRLPPPSTRAYIVSKAVEYMHAHLTEPPLIARICKEVRVCPRTLRYSFEEIVGVSPAHYLLTLRLSGVRRELLAGGGAAGIYRIAQRYSFRQMSRFAAFYRQAFGELPSETCRRAESYPLQRRALYRD